MSLYTLPNKGYFLILFAPKDMALEKNQAKRSTFKNKLFTFWIILATAISSQLLGILGNLGISFREEGVNDLYNL